MPLSARPWSRSWREVETRRDAAVRELSEKFDKWSPPSFKLSENEVERAIGQVAKRDLEDIKFAQAQVRNFAQKQKATHARPGGRDAAGRDPRPQAHPRRVDRLLRAGRALSDGRLGAHVDRHRAGGGREAHHRLRAAAPGRAASGHRRRHAFRRRRRDLRAGRRAGGRRHGARHRDDRRRSTWWSAPATPTWRKPSASCSAASASTCWPAPPRR